MAVRQSFFKWLQTMPWHQRGVTLIRGVDRAPTKFGRIETQHEQPRMSGVFLIASHSYIVSTSHVSADFAGKCLDRNSVYPPNDWHTLWIPPKETLLENFEPVKDGYPHFKGLLWAAHTLSLAPCYPCFGHHRWGGPPNLETLPAPKTLNASEHVRAGLFKSDSGSVV